MCARNRRGAEPLHYAVDGVPGSRSWDPAAQAATVASLIDAGADPNSTTLFNCGLGAGEWGLIEECSVWIEDLLGTDDLRGAQLAINPQFGISNPSINLPSPVLNPQLV